MSQVWKIKLYCIPGEHYSNLTHFHCLFLNVDVSKKKKKKKKKLQQIEKEGKKKKRCME